MYTLDDLRYLMSRLRDPEHGCPWDLKQSFSSIVPHTLEEAFEVADAIERGDRDEIKDELGDLLFQVIFYSQLGSEERCFDFDDVVNNIVEKLVRRHPHVFPDGDLRAFHPAGTSFTDEQIKAQWEAIKSRERALKAKQADVMNSANDACFDPARDSVLSDIPANLPSLNRAEKLQKRASQHGFDWQDIEPVFAKIEEELDEVREVLAGAEDVESLREPEIHARLQDEMGDLLFCCVNLARFLRVSPDASLRSTNQKFFQRFQYIEERLHQQGRSLEQVSLEELDQLWDEAKFRSKNQTPIPE